MIRIYFFILKLYVGFTFPFNQTNHLELTTFKILISFAMGNKMGRSPDYFKPDKKG